MLVSEWILDIINLSRSLSACLIVCSRMCISFNIKNQFRKLFAKTGGLLGLQIERKWGFIKRRIKHHTTGTMPGLVKAYKLVIKELDVQTCRRFARSTRDYIRAYISGAGDDGVDQEAKMYKSHR